MKTELLKELGLTEEQISTIMAENGKDIERYKKDVEKYKEQYEGTKASLEDANTQIESYKAMDIEGIQKAVKDWEEKYEKETNALSQKLAQKDYDYAMNDYFSNIKFSSESAKQGVISQFKEKAFKFEEGKFVGADEFMNSLKEKDSSAFVIEEQNDPLPIFSRSTQTNTKPIEQTGMAFNFNGVRPKPKTND